MAKRVVKGSSTSDNVASSRDDDLAEVKRDGTRHNDFHDV